MGEMVDLLGVATADVGIAEMLAHHGAVFALDQGIVIGAPGVGLGELLDVQLAD